MQPTLPTADLGRPLPETSKPKKPCTYVEHQLINRSAVSTPGDPSTNNISLQPSRDSSSADLEEPVPLVPMSEAAASTVTGQQSVSSFAAPSFGSTSQLPQTSFPAAAPQSMSIPVVSMSGSTSLTFQIASQAPSTLTTLASYTHNPVHLLVLQNLTNAIPQLPRDIQVIDLWYVLTVAEPRRLKPVSDRWFAWYYVWVPLT